MSLATLIFSHLYSIFYIFSIKFYFLEKFMPKIMPINLEKYASVLDNKKAQKLRLYLMFEFLTILYKKLYYIKKNKIIYIMLAYMLALCYNIHVRR